MSETGGLRVSPLDRLVVLRGVLKDPVVDALHTLLATDPSDDVTRTRAYAELAFELFSRGEATLREEVLATVLDDENIYVEIVRADEEPSRALRTALECDLRNIQAACAGKAEDLKGEISSPHLLPSIQMGSDINFVTAYYRGISDEGMTVEDLVEEAQKRKPEHLAEPEPVEDAQEESTAEPAEEPVIEPAQTAPDATDDSVSETDEKDRVQIVLRLPRPPAPVARAGKRLVHWIKN